MLKPPEVRYDEAREDAQEFLALWRKVLNDPSLQDLPYKVELDDWRRIVLSPATNLHALLAFEIATWLRGHLKGGRAFTESAVLTRSGVRVPDAVWASKARMVGANEVFSVAPEICVEVISPSNKAGAIEEKIGLYFDAGAVEVWTCDLEGHMRFFDSDGVLEQSKLAPKFPSLVELP